MYRQAFISSGRAAREAARGGAAAAAASASAAASVPDSVIRLSEELIAMPNLTSNELVLLRKLRNGASYREIETTMGQLMSAPKNDTVIGDALRKIIETVETSEGDGDCGRAVLDKMFCAFEPMGSDSSPDSGSGSGSGSSSSSPRDAFGTGRQPSAVDVLQRILSPGGAPIVDASDAAERYAGSVIRTLIEAFSIFGNRTEPIPQARISANNARAHVLNELMPPRWPDLFRIIWRRVCGTPIMPPDPEMDEARIIEKFVNVSPEEVEKMENLPQGSAEWLAARRFRVSGSTVASLVNLSPYASYEEWLVDKLYQQTYSNAAMRHGSITEAVARDFFERSLLFMGCRGISVVERGFMINPAMGGWAGASPDGLVDLGDGRGKAVLEIKCPFYDKKSFYSEREKYDSNPWGIPEQYYCQIQYLMHLMGYKYSYFVVHLPHRTQIMLFVYNPPFAKALYEAAKEVFYSKFIPTAAKYFKGELPFGHITPQNDSDVVDLRITPLLLASRRRPAEETAAAAEPPCKRAREDRRVQEEERHLREAEADERVESHIKQLSVRNEHDRYKWTISVRNDSVSALWDLLQRCEGDPVQKDAMHSMLNHLPRYAIEDSERGKATIDAFLKALESDPVATARVLVQHTTGDLTPVDFLSVERGPFEVANPEREHEVVERLQNVLLHKTIGHLLE